MKNRLLLLAVLVSNLVFSQRMSISQVYEARSTGTSSFRNQTEIEISVSGDEVRKYKFARLATLTKAEDDQGFDMIGEKTSSDYAEVSGNSATIRLELVNASRKAETIKELSGTVKLFAPTEANGGLVKIKNFGSQVNKDLLPKDKELDVLFLTKESYELLVNEDKAKRDAELKKQTKEMQELAKGMMEIMDAFSFHDWSYPQINLMIKGDYNKLVDVKVLMPDGTEINRNGSSYTNNLKTYFFSEEIKPSYTMVLTVETSGAVKTIPLNMKEIVLP